MSLKESGDDALAVVDAFDGGFGWLAHPTEAMRRASHALETDAGAFLVDPLDAPGLDSELDDRLTGGADDVAGVVVLLGRHERDARVIADRYGVPIYAPRSESRGFGTRTRRFDDGLPGTEFEAVEVLDWPGWYEAALFDGETLVVPEALGTAGFFLAPGERLGVHPAVRPLPPKRLLDLRPDRLLVGHGEGIAEGATAAIRSAIEGSRKNAPAAWWKALRDAV